MTTTANPPELARIDEWLRNALEGAPTSGRSGAQAATWSDGQVEAILETPLSPDRFSQVLSMASRYGPRGPLAPSERMVAAAEGLVPGWNPERWTALEALRVRLIVAQARSDAEGLPAAIEEAFRYADEGELCALYRSLQFLPGPERFVWQAQEGCRTNMKTVFEANGCDSAFPAAHFDDVAWRQLCIKMLFVEAPLWRVSGFDSRVDDELARMALDLAEERRSAGRRIYPELWMCLGTTADPRALEAIESELSGSDELSRKAAILALGRMGNTERLSEIERDGGSLFGQIAQWALMGRHAADAFASVSPPEGAEPSTFDSPSIDTPA